MQSPKKKKSISGEQENPYEPFFEEEPKTTEQGPLIPQNQEHQDDEIGPWNDFMSPKFSIPSARLNSTRKTEMAKTFDKPITFTMRPMQRPHTNEKKSRALVPNETSAIKTPSHNLAEKDLIFENEFIRNKIEGPTSELEKDIPKIDLAATSSAKVIRTSNLPSKREKKAITTSYFAADQLENPFREPEFLDYRTMDDRRPRGSKRPLPFFQGKITAYNLYNFGLPPTNTIFHHVIEGEGFTPKIPGTHEKTESGASTNHGPPPQNHPIHHSQNHNPQIDRMNNESPMLTTTIGPKAFLHKKKIEYKSEDVSPRKTAGTFETKEIFDVSGKKSGLYDVRDRFNAFQQEKINKVIEREERRRLEKEKTVSIDQSAISKQEELKSRLKILKKINSSVPPSLKKFRVDKTTTSSAKILQAEIKSPKNSTPSTPSNYLFPVVSATHGTPNLKKILDAKQQYERNKKGGSDSKGHHDSKEDIIITDLNAIGGKGERPLIESQYSNDAMIDRSKTKERFSHHVHQYPVVDPPSMALEGQALSLSQSQTQFKGLKTNPMMPISMTQSSIFPSQSKQNGKVSNLRPSFSHKNRSLKPSASMENTLNSGFGNTKKVL